MAAPIPAFIHVLDGVTYVLPSTATIAPNGPALVEQLMHGAELVVKAGRVVKDRQGHRLPTNLEEFKAWLKREQAEFTFAEDTDGGGSIVIQNEEHVAAYIHFRPDGSLWHIDVE